jgi:hypothetical protein
MNTDILYDITASIDHQEEQFSICILAAFGNPMSSLAASLPSLYCPDPASTDLILSDSQPQPWTPFWVGRSSRSISSNHKVPSCQRAMQGIDWKIHVPHRHPSVCRLHDSYLLGQSVLDQYQMLQERKDHRKWRSMIIRRMWFNI